MLISFVISWNGEIEKYPIHSLNYERSHYLLRLYVQSLVLNMILGAVIFESVSRMDWKKVVVTEALEKLYGGLLEIISE